jgi:hypothetical protein
VTWRSLTLGAPDDVEADDTTSEDVERLHALWRRPWWAVAKVALSEGLDVHVLDPEGAEVAGAWSLGDSATLEVTPSTAVGWTLIVQAQAEEES